MIKGKRGQLPRNPLPAKLPKPHPPEPTMSQPDPEFAPSNLEAWPLAAAKSAPGGDLGRLNWVTPDGIEVKPLYTARDVKGLAHTDTLPAFESYVRGPQATTCAARRWTSRQYAGFSTAEESNAFYRK